MYVCLSVCTGDWWQEEGYWYSGQRSQWHL